ncbi:MAG: DUF2103 domain-containing protein [Thermaerobacter sp.]|nr:DUF2103 domain-containing protein [Thermaerobacter sp.]
MAKFRHSKIKRRHHVLKELEPGLAFLANLDMVDGIIPGTINPKAGSSMGFSFQYITASGFKLIGRSSGAAQEIFVITGDSAAVLGRLRDSGLIP